MRRILTTSFAAAGALAASAPSALASHDPAPAIETLTLGAMGTVSVTGSITCPTPVGSSSRYGVDVSLVQRSGRTLTMGWGGTGGPCETGGPKKWSIPLLLGTAPFHQGKVLVTLSGCTYSDEEPYASECVSVTREPVVMRLTHR